MHVCDFMMVAMNLLTLTEKSVKLDSWKLANATRVLTGCWTCEGVCAVSTLAPSWGRRNTRIDTDLLCDVSVAVCIPTELVLNKTFMDLV